MDFDFYRPSNNVKDTNRTYVPDMYRQQAQEMKEEDSVAGSADTPSRTVQLQNRPLVGVLYSLSAGADGELFPVYVGRNIVGSDLSCDICLRETSVSGQHGILLARKQTDVEGREFINVSLSDTNSSYGTTLNGERLGFDKVACSDGDVITIGQNYVLVLSLFNALDKLSVSYGFDRIPEPKVEEPRPAVKPVPFEGMIPHPLPPMPDFSHSSNPTKELDTTDEASMDFYKPTAKEETDHYNNKTIIL